MDLKGNAIYLVLFILWPVFLYSCLKWTNYIDGDENITAIFPQRPLQDIACLWLKCCETYERSIMTSVLYMKLQLKEYLHGQRMAINALTTIIENKYASLRLGQPICIELYGPSGTGKVLASELMAESIFSRGMNTPLVHTFDGEDVQFRGQQSITHQEHVKDWIKGNLTNCKKSMFILKHTEKLPFQLLRDVQNIIKSNKGGIFIFTTTEKREVVSKRYQKLLKQGIRKRYMTQLQFKLAMRRTLFGMTDRVLFLPMEEKDLKYCMLDEFERLRYYVPSRCMVEKVYRKFALDKNGYTATTCKDIVNVTNNVAKYGKC